MKVFRKAIVLIGIIAAACQLAVAATFYVRTTGDDTTGNGSSLLPWKTVSKAQATMTSGDTVNIGDGTYNETTAAAGFFNINRAFTSTTTFQSESGIPTNVIITGQGSNSFNVLTNAANSGYHFKDLTFASFVSTNTSTFRISQTSTMTFTNCQFRAPVDATAIRYAMQIVQSAATTISSVTFNNCTMTSTQTLGTAIGVNQVASGITSGLTFINVISTGGSLPLDFTGTVSAFSVIGGTFTGYGGYGVKVGQDSDVAAGTLTGSIRGATILTTAANTGGSGHGLLIGAGTSSVTVTGCNITGADYGIVNKENQGSFIANNTVRGGSISVANGSAIYFKASTGTAINNIFTTTATVNAGTIRVGAGDTGNKCGAIVFKNNRINATNVKALNWAAAIGDAGGSISDYNTYNLTGTATYGDVFGTTGITTLAGVRTAWSTYSVKTNDSHSIDASIIPLIFKKIQSVRRNR